MQKRFLTLLALFTLSTCSVWAQNDGDQTGDPAADATSVTFTMKNTSDAIINVIDMAGKVVATQSLSGVNGTQVVEINTSALNSGMYTVTVAANGTTVSKKLAIRK